MRRRGLRRRPSEGRSPEGIPSPHVIHLPHPYGPIFPLRVLGHVFDRDGRPSARHGCAPPSRSPARRCAAQAPLHTPTATTLVVSVSRTPWQKAGASARAQRAGEASLRQRTDSNDAQRDGQGRCRWTTACGWSGTRTAPVTIAGLFGRPSAGPAGSGCLDRAASLPRWPRRRVLLRVARLHGTRPTVSPFINPSCSMRGSL